MKKQNEAISNTNLTVIFSSQRNHYIDVLKGIAIISVVLIHTAFHSGNSYVPRWFANFTLLFEVPVFFFLAGWSYSYSKGNRSYFQGLILTQIKYMIFMVLIYLSILVADILQKSNNHVTLTTLCRWFFHTYSSTAPFQGVSSSLWFFRVYFFVSMLGAMTITLLKPNARKTVTVLCFLAIFIITFFAPQIGKIHIGIELSYVFFYLFFYLLGFSLKDKQISLKQFVLLIAAVFLSLIAIWKVKAIDVTALQAHKFPPNFIFLLWSLFGIFFILLFKKRFLSCKPNFLSNIGQNSMYIFLAQGIGSSVLFWLSKYFTMPWYYKVWIMFGINLWVTAAVTLVLKLLLDPLGKRIKKILKEKVFA